MTTNSKMTQQQLALTLQDAYMYCEAAQGQIGVKDGMRPGELTKGEAMRRAVRLSRRAGIQHSLTRIDRAGRLLAAIVTAAEHKGIDAYTGAVVCADVTHAPTCKCLVTAR